MILGIFFVQITAAMQKQEHWYLVLILEIIKSLEINIISKRSTSASIVYREKSDI